MYSRPRCGHDTSACSRFRTGRLRLRSPKCSPAVPSKSIRILEHQLLECGSHPRLISLFGTGHLDLCELLVVEHVRLEERLEVRDGRPLKLRRRQLGHELEDGMQLARSDLAEGGTGLEVDGSYLLVDTLCRLLL